MQGYMYQDTSKKSADEKIKSILTQYQNKFGVPPKFIVTNSTVIPSPIDGISFRQAKYIMPNVFWLGME